MKVLWGVLFASAVFAADAPRLFYSKSFPGSVPAFAQITLEAGGDATYQEAADDDLPLKFKLAQSDVGEVFQLVEKLDYFKRPLESPLKVAFTGTKTFRYEAGNQRSELQFNFTEDQTGRLLLDWFERIAQSAQCRIELDRAAKYDRLGVVKALLRVQSGLENKRLVALDQYLPTLDRIAKNESYMHTAREKAAGIADVIRNPK